jgi:hypothetical protein
MKKFAALIACFVLLHPCVHSEESVKRGEKVYLSQESLTIIDNMILVQTSDGLFSTSALFCDADGLFSYTRDLSHVQGKYIHNGEFVDERLERVCPNGHRYAKCYYDVCPVCKCRGNLAKKNDK